MTVGAVPAAEARSLSERIRLALADDISSGRIKPGSTLEEAQVTERFSTSRTPVREAFRQLEAAGLVEARPRKGVVVLPMTIEQLSAMFEMCGEMESVCARLATLRMTASERGELQELHAASEMLIEQNDIDEYDAYNARFHEILYHATRNQFLVEQLALLKMRMRPFRRTQLRGQDRLYASFAEHTELLRALSRGEPDEAASVMRQHLANAASSFTRYYGHANVDEAATE